VIGPVTREEFLRREPPFRAGNLLYNAEGLVREVLFSYGHQLSPETHKKVYEIYNEMKRLEYGK
jgi:hypothetical protein